MDWDRHDQRKYPRWMSRPILILHTYTHTQIHTNYKPTWTHGHTYTHTLASCWLTRLIKKMETTLSLKSADASFRAEDVKDESLKLIKNHYHKSDECTHEYQKKKKNLQRNLWDVIYFYNFTLFEYAWFGDGYQSASLKIKSQQTFTPQFKHGDA